MLMDTLIIDQRRKQKGRRSTDVMAGCWIIPALLMVAIMSWHLCKLVHGVA